jgi:hypothetical protein
VTDGAVDPGSIATLVALRRRYRPEPAAGAAGDDVLAAALDPGSGLVAGGAARA